MKNRLLPFITSHFGKLSARLRRAQCIAMVTCHFGKLSVILLSFVNCPSSLHGQTIPPPFINYQAVLYDQSSPIPNDPLDYENIQTFVNINDELGNLLYREEHYASTDGNGLITVKMGDGLYVAGPITNFNQIDWGTGKYYLVVDFNINNTISSTAPEQLVTVPYSFYSGKAGNGMTSVVDNGNGTLTFTYANGSTYTTPTLSGIQGPAGLQGPAGAAGATGPVGPTGQSAYELWLAQGNTGTVQDFLSSSAYQIWLAQGNTGTAQDFLNTLVGPSGASGQAGPQGVAGVQGPIGPTGPQGIQGPIGPAGAAGAQGISGANGLNSLIKTTAEPAGVNCTNGGTKIETGLDANGDGVLEPGEINATQTTYVCGSQTNQGIGLGFSNMQVFSNPGTFSWTVPEGVTKIMIEVWGGGGASTDYTKGGSGGGYGKQVFNVISNSIYSIIVASGGSLAIPNGGTSSFGNLISATGGASNFGLPGSSSATFSISGGSGGDYYQAGLVFGGSGANGGPGGSNNTGQLNGKAPGGGGAGSGNPNFTASSGGNGRVVIWY
jgi:hypothetical protein